MALSKNYVNKYHPIRRQFKPPLPPSRFVLGTPPNLYKVLYRSVTLPLELMKSDFGDDWNAANAVVHIKQLTVCYLPKEFNNLHQKK